MSLIHNATFDSQTRVLSLLDKAGNVTSSCEVPSKSKELTLTATEDNSSVKLTKYGTISNKYEVDTGSGWVPYTFDTVINLNAGQSCKWRCISRPTTFSSTTYVQFVMTGKIEASNPVTSIIKDDLEPTSLDNYACASLFDGCTSIVKAPALPATKLADYCYYSMFKGCTGLTQAPELPATTLAYSCYYSMFQGCTGLTQAPELPATTLANYCYLHMFQGCTGLTQAPELPATILADDCYSSMFKGCTGLTQAPELPATTLADYCYYSMFDGCTGLTQAPELPARKLAKDCYYFMFYGCKSLKEVRISATTTATNALKNWLYDVSATGDFYCDPNSTIFPSGGSGIPSGWRRLNINDYPVTP